MTSEILGDELWNLRHGEIGQPVGSLQSLDRAGQPLTAELVAELAARGLLVGPRDVRADLAIQRAGALIHRAPSLERVVLGCVREVLILDAPDDSHDVSHSEPRWPHLIFVSLAPPTPVGDLRLAEAIVHEAMHLNLSFAEERTSLVADDAQLYSPWRSTARPAGGVLHGAYVFAVLLRFFEDLDRQTGFSPEERKHLAGRRRDILEECRQVPRAALFRLLTKDGQAIARRVFEVVDHQLP
jgi:HEXXH motif-containing protein